MHPADKRSRALAGALAGLGLFISACADGPEAPTDPTAAESGALDVATNTTGSRLDPDGYGLLIDGEPGPSIGINATASLADLEAGVHEVGLVGVAENCAVTSPNPVTVEVVGGATAEASFSVSCTARLGAIVVTVATTSTTGAALELDQDGYQLSIDGAFGGHVGVNSTITIVGFDDGEHQIELAGLDANCAVAGENPQTAAVEESSTAEVRFDILCESVPRPIAFTRNGALYIMTADGSSLRQLPTGFTGGVTGPAWSPDGSRIAFGPELWCWFDCDIFIMDASGGNVTRVTRTGDNDAPAWSPDGSRIAFTSWRDGHDEVYLIDVDGSNLVRLTHGSEASGSPAWSPDGSRIAFGSDRDGDPEVWVMDADGSNPVRLTHEPGFDGDPTWSPDGTRIAFTGVRDGNYDIYVMGADGTDVVRLTHGQGIESYPTWSSDGSRIAFVSEGDIFVMNADGSGRRNLTDDPAFELFPNWRP